MEGTKLDDAFTVGPQILADDVVDIIEAGYRIVICNRPDGEEPGQPRAGDIAAACEVAGLEFHHLPFQGANVSPDTVDAFRKIVENAAGPIFAYCRSGQRCAYLWTISRT